MTDEQQTIDTDNENKVIEDQSSSTPARPNLESLLEKRLLIFTGKGGVGKTTISAAFALRAANLGMRTVLLPIDSTAQVEKYFKKEIGQDLVELDDKLYGRHLDRLHIFDEFIKNTLKIRRIYDIILNSPVYQYFSAVAPGIKELIAWQTVKHYVEKETKITHRSKYDLVIVDAPATGHGLSFMDAPKAIKDTVKMGPIYNRAAGVDDMLHDKDNTAVVLVSLAEEMPANEAVEMYQRLTDLHEMQIGAMIINSIEPSVFQIPEKEQLYKEKKESGELQEALKEIFNTGSFKKLPDRLLKNIDFQVSRRDLNNRYVKMLKEKLQVKTLEVEYLPLKGIELLTAIGSCLI